MWNYFNSCKRSGHLVLWWVPGLNRGGPSYTAGCEGLVCRWESVGPRAHSLLRMCWALRLVDQLHKVSASNNWPTAPTGLPPVALFSLILGERLWAASWCAGQEHPPLPRKKQVSPGGGGFIVGAVSFSGASCWVGENNK